MLEPSRRRRMPGVSILCCSAEAPTMTCAQQRCGGIVYSKQRSRPAILVLAEEFCWNLRVAVERWQVSNFRKFDSKQALCACTKVDPHQDTASFVCRQRAKHGYCQTIDMSPR